MNKHIFYGLLFVSVTLMAGVIVTCASLKANSVPIDFPQLFTRVIYLPLYYFPMYSSGLNRFLAILLIVMVITLITLSIKKCKVWLCIVAYILFSASWLLLISSAVNVPLD